MKVTILPCALLFYFTSAIYANAPQAQSGNTTMWADMLSSNDGTILDGDSTRSFINISASSNFSDPIPRISVNCFDPGDFHPTTKAYYLEAVQKILVRLDAFYPRIFFLGPVRRFIWSGGPFGSAEECGIVLGNQRLEFTAKFPFILVAHVAALIAEECINEENGYAGGWAAQGPRMGIVLVGHLQRDAAQIKTLLSRIDANGSIET